MKPLRFLLLFFLFSCFQPVSVIAALEEEEGFEMNASRDQYLKLEELAQSLRNVRNPFVSQLPEPPPPVVVQPVNSQFPNPPNIDPNQTQPAIMLPSDYQRLSTNQNRSSYNQDNSKSGQSGMDLLGVVWNTKKPQAIINSKVYSVGDKLNDNEIISIKKSGVTLKAISGQTFKIKMKK